MKLLSSVLDPAANMVAPGPGFAGFSPRVQWFRARMQGMADAAACGWLSKLWSLFGS